MVDEPRHLPKTFLHVENFQDLLFLLDSRIDDGGDHVRQGSRIGDGLRHQAEFLGQEGRKLHDAVEKRQEVRDQGLHFEVLHGDLLDRRHLGLEVGLNFREGEDLEAADALHQQLRFVIDRLGHAQNHAGGPNGIHVFRSQGLIRLGLFRFYQADEAVPGHRVVHQLHGFLADDLHGEHHLRKNEDVVQRQDGKHLGQGECFGFFGRFGFRHVDLRGTVCLPVGIIPGKFRSCGSARRGAWGA